MTEHLIAQANTEIDYSKGGVLLIDKPLRWTSFDVVSKVRIAMKHKYGKRHKVGHAGTLDPLASGLLILCTGAFTKKINEFQDMEKEYTGVFFLGATRPSYDKETEIDETFSTSNVTEDLIHKATKQFIGEINQIPPVYSAIKIDGKRAYESARKGKEIEMVSRKVTISSFEITKIEMPNVHFKVKCSKGTYIRSLARDFGKALGCGAYLDALIRTRIGDFDLKNAMNIQQAQDLFKKDV
jgi:tRNA pseudouridine55 synthase